jgi:hypothetical protein
VSDEEIRSLAREAEASRDGGTWLRFAQLLAREGRYDEAGAAVLSAEQCGADGGEVLESFAPTKFTLRVLAEGPARPGAVPRLDWSRDGKLYVAEHAPDGTSGIVAWDVARGRAHAVALNLPLARIEFLVAGSGEPLLLGYGDKDRIQAAFVKKGFLQPSLDPSFDPSAAALWPDRVFLCDGQTVVCRTEDDERIWKLRARKTMSLGTMGNVVTLDRKTLALYDPLAKEPRKTWGFANKRGTPYAVRRRALVVEGRCLAGVFSDHVVEREVRDSASRPFPSPSLRHLVHMGSNDSLLVTDMRTGETETIELPPAFHEASRLRRWIPDRPSRPGELVEHFSVSWSPSGRKVALAAVTGELYLLEGE